VDNLFAEPAVVKWIKEHIPNYKEEAIVVSPDAGGAKVPRASPLAERMLKAVLRIRIRDPMPFWPRDPGWVKNQDPDPG
jgi:phosphoribosylpyrophosphate synthetase